LFRFYIPLEQQIVKSIEPEIYKTNGPKSETNNSELILIVEDDDINYFFFEELFSETNHSVIRAIDGLQAVDLVTTDKNIQLVLMDIKMPKMNGYEALKKIKEIRPELPVIAQTSYALYDDIVKINQAGFDDYISKPIVREKLMEIVKNHLSMNA
jgi:CheY-like chemotaxis protein